MKKKLIIYELNEVPLKLIEHYCNLYPYSTFSEIRKNGILKETYTYDSGELHPWVTWPTVHRGVGNKLHKITSINQNLDHAKRFPPIWERLIDMKIDIGIFGALQSYPPIKNKFVKFYLPDTFSPTKDTFPDYLSSFQAFNLYLAGKNKAITSNLNIKSIILFFKLIFSFPFILRVSLKLIFQIIYEFIEPINKIRRSLFQPILGFEIYHFLVNKYKPTYTSFFTNHVAGVMHRYWKYVFTTRKLNKKEEFYSNSIIEAMQIADKELERILKFIKNDGYTLLVISSMGQDSINRGDYVPELYLEDFNLLLKSLDLNISKYKLMPAMQPDVCISSESIFYREKLREAIRKLKTSEGDTLIIERYEPNGLNVNFSLKTYPIIANLKKLIFDKKIYKISSFGLKTIKRDIGTGYHIPEGIFMSYGKYQDYFKTGEEIIDTRNISKMIFEFYRK